MKVYRLYQDNSGGTLGCDESVPDGEYVRVDDLPGPATVPIIDLAKYVVEHARTRNMEDHVQIWITCGMHEMVSISIGQLRAFVAEWNETSS